MAITLTLLIFQSLLILKCFNSIIAATHWVVTEDGKIQTQDGSVFSLRRPYDLVALLEQEKRADVLKAIKKQLLVQKESIETSADVGNDEKKQGGSLTDSGVDVEQVIYANSDDCKKAGKTLPEFDLYVGTILFLPAVKADSTMSKNNFDITFTQKVTEIIDDRLSGDAFLNKFKTKSNDLKQPNCSEIYSLDFSMHSYQHLESIKKRIKLKIEPEREIHLTISSLKDIDEFGDAIYHNLRQNNTYWVLFTLASFYWRAKGNAVEAVECLRRALHFCPYQFKHIPLVSLGNVLHRAHSSEEASIVFHHAIDVSPKSLIAHFTLGNVYAALGDYNKSLACFKNALKLDPSFNEARLTYHAVICHQKVEKALRAQHDSLQKTLEELQGYQKQQELWLQYQQKLLSEQTPPGVLLEQRLQYREHKIREIIGTNLNSQGNGNDQGISEKEIGGLDLRNDNIDTVMIKRNHITIDEGKVETSGSSQDISSTGISSNSALSSCSASCNKCSNDNQEECHMVPILIPITFTPPS